MSAFGRLNGFLLPTIHSPAIDLLFDCRSPEHHPLARSGNRQRGSALIISLAMLTVLTVAAGVALQETTLQNRAITNYSVKQQVRTASVNSIGRTYGNLNAYYEALGSDALDDLMALISSEKNAIQSQTDNGTSDDELSYDNVGLNPYSQYGWEQPSTIRLNAVGTVSTQIYYDTAHPINSNCLKCNAGSSGGQTSRYPFRIVATTTDSNGKIVSRQVQGITLTGAGAN